MHIYHKAFVSWWIYTLCLVASNVSSDDPAAPTTERPKISGAIDGSSEIAIPSGTRKAISVKVQITNQLIIQSRFVCAFNIEGRSSKVNAQLLADTIYCEPTEFTYSDSKPTSVATFEVIWGGSNSFDNPNNVTVVIYKCANMADDCGKCIELKAKYACGWCEGSNKCELNSQCSNSRWFIDDHYCPSPCSNLTSCTSCVTSTHSCDWCVDRNVCTNEIKSQCADDLAVAGVNSKITSNKGPEFCPRVDATDDGKLEILVPAGTQKVVRVKTRNLSSEMKKAKFLCNFSVGGQTMTVGSQLLDDVIQCDSVKLSYRANEPHSNASFSVNWGESKFLDNPKNIIVVMFKCDQMAEEYFHCLSLEKKFSCGWCESTEKCQIQPQCAGSWTS